MFAVTYDPKPGSFQIGKGGGSAPLSVTVSINSSETKKVQFIFSSPSGISSSNTVFVIEGNNSKTITITAPANLNQPYFTIQATGQDENGDTRNQDSYAATFTWKPQ